MKTDSKKIFQKREKEKQIVSLMIRIYCNKKHHTKGENLCENCKHLQNYACSKSEHCPFMENKTFCSNCRVHCYAKLEREEIKKVMRFSGPRMIFYHPIKAVSHVILSVREKKKLSKENGEVKNEC